MNKVVVRIADGRTVKGFTNDFSPDKAHFHVNLAEPGPDAKAVDLEVADLKALYFVKALPETQSMMTKKHLIRPGARWAERFASSSKTARR